MVSRSVSPKVKYAYCIPATGRIHGRGEAVRDGAFIPGRKIARKSALRNPFELALIEAIEFGILRRLLAVRDRQVANRISRLLYEDLRQSNHVVAVLKSLG